MLYDLLADLREVAPGHLRESEAWEASCRRLIWLTYAAVVTLLVVLPLIEYARYGALPQWIFWDLADFFTKQKHVWRGALIMSETFFSSVLLGMTCVLGLLHYTTITRVSPTYRPDRLFWLLSGLGFFWLTCDEFFGLHEYIGHRLEQAGVPRPPVGQLDDLIMPGIPAVVGLIGFIFLRKALIPHKARLRFFGAGIGFLVVSTYFDIFNPVEEFPRRILEDGTKVLAGTSFLLFYLLTYLDAIGHFIEPPRSAPHHEIPAKTP